MIMVRINAYKQSTSSHQFNSLSPLAPILVSHNFSLSGMTHPAFAEYFYQFYSFNFKYKFSSSCSSFTSRKSEFCYGPKYFRNFQKRRKYMRLMSVGLITHASNLVVLMIIHPLNSVSHQIKYAPFATPATYW